MRNRIFEITGVLSRERSILFDIDGLWTKFNCDEAAQEAGLCVVHIQDEMALRFQYEQALINRPADRILFVIDRRDIYIPMDITRMYYVFQLTFEAVFPTLSAEALRGLLGLDFDWLVACIDKAPFGSMNAQQTLAWCHEGMYQADVCCDYAATLLERARALAMVASDHRDWDSIAKLYGKAAMVQHSGISLPNWAEARMEIENAFAAWIGRKYNMLSGSIDRMRPVLLSKVADFVRRAGDKVALVVMDGMSFENFFMLQREMAACNIAFEIESSFSFFPTITCVARQSIFSGKLPSEHPKPFSLDNEERQWRAFWMNTGLRDHEIIFHRGLITDMSQDVRALGIVVGIIDELMHAELQGHPGIQQGLCEWARTGRFAKMLQMLLENGFSTFITSDHGNTSAIAAGRFVKPGVLAEPASRRAIIYNASFDARELDKFDVMRYAGTYLPGGYDAYLFNIDSCYGDAGKEYITHGGMALEEAIVPFVRIGGKHG